MTVKLLTEHYLQFLSLKRDCKDYTEPTLVKMPHCWKSHVAAHMLLFHHNIIVREPAIGLIKWLRLKGSKVCFYVEKCAKFRIQPL